MNSSNYEDSGDIQFNIIENVIYLVMKNDISFIILSELNLWEHQSTYNPNMPMRLDKLSEK